MSRRPLRTMLDAVLVALFALALLAPAIDLAVRPAQARSVLRENRNPAQPPARITGLTTLSKFPSSFERWFDDRMGLRDRLLRARQALILFVFRGEASPTLITGEDGWLYFGADHSVPVQRGVAPFTADELASWRRDVEERRDWLRARGIEYVFAIAPNKQSVYPEHVPDVLEPVGPTRLDQLAAYMSAHSDVRFVDLRAALLAEKAHDGGGDFTYYPLGSHWGWRGAWAGWNAIAAAAADARPAPRAIPREACALREVSEAAADTMAAQTYIQDLVHQPAFAFEPTSPAAALVRDARGVVTSSTQDDATLPSLVFVHDSFGTWILPFAAEGSARMQASWQHGFPKDLIQAARPDLVVQLYTERMLVWGLPPLAPDVELVEAESFERFAPLWKLDLAAGELPATEGGVSVSRRGAGWSIEMRSTNGVVLLPAVEVPDGGELAVHVDVVAPASGSMNLFYQLAGEPGFARSRAAVVALREGANDVRFRVRVPGVRGPMKVRVGTAPGTYVLRALETRAAPGP